MSRVVIPRAYGAMIRSLNDGGHEKLPIDGQIAARWRTSDLPGGGH
jgi:hypothetical protein